MRPNCNPSDTAKNIWLSVRRQRIHIRSAMSCTVYHFTSAQRAHFMIAHGLWKITTSAKNGPSHPETEPSLFNPNYHVHCRCPPRLEYECVGMEPRPQKVSDRAETAGTGDDGQAGSGQRRRILS